eukprot:6075-Heterococcus_DN1.PRE.1
MALETCSNSSMLLHECGSRRRILRLYSNILTHLLLLTPRLSTSPTPVVAPSFKDEAFYLDRLYAENVPDRDATEPIKSVQESKSSMGSRVVVAWNFCCGMAYCAALYCVLHTLLRCCSRAATAMHVILYTIPLTPTLAQHTHDRICYVLCCYTAYFRQQLSCLMFLDAARYLDRGDSYYDFKMRVLMLPTRLTAVVRNVQQQIVMGLLAAIVCTLSYASAYVVSELVGSCNE